MSDPTKDQSFRSSPWNTGTGAGEAGKEQVGEGFKSLYSNRDETEQNGFVASFISEEKARAIATSPKAPPDEASPEGLEGVKRRAYDEAFTKGQEAGLEEGRQQSREIIDRLAHMMVQVESAWTNLIETHESQIIELVTRAVEKVVYGQAAIEQEMVKRAILEALRVVPEPVHVQISVNPKDYEYIETVKEDFFSSIQALKDVSVTPDPAIHQGGCNVRTKFGEVDATIENRLEAIRECLLTANGKKAGPK